MTAEEIKKYWAVLRNELTPVEAAEVFMTENGVEFFRSELDNAGAEEYGGVVFSYQMIFNKYAYDALCRAGEIDPEQIFPLGKNPPAPKDMGFKGKDTYRFNGETWDFCY